MTRMFLRRILNGGRGLVALARVKETTGIMGLEVVPNPQEVLIDLYTCTLKEIKVVPKDEGYRKAVESFKSYRLQVYQEEHDWEAIKKHLGCSQGDQGDS